MDRKIKTLIAVPKAKSTEFLLDVSQTRGVTIRGYKEDAAYGEVHISLEGKPLDLRRIRESTREGKVRGCLDDRDGMHFAFNCANALKQRR